MLVDTNDIESLLDNILRTLIQKNTQTWESSQVGRDFMRDNHFFDDLWKAFEELGDKKMSRFD